MRRLRIAGVTLVELVVSITVVGIAIAGVLGALAAVSTRGAEAMVRAQAAAIGAAYLNEILAKSFTSTPVEASRALYDDVSDYDGLLDLGVHDQWGNAVGLQGLNRFAVAVAVVPGALGAVPPAEVKRIDVTVTHPSGVTVVISGYRTLYP